VPDNPWLAYQWIKLINGTNNVISFVKAAFAAGNESIAA